MGSEVLGYHYITDTTWTALIAMQGLNRRHAVAWMQAYKATASITPSDDGELCNLTMTALSYPSQLSFLTMLCSFLPSAPHGEDQLV